MLTVAVIAATRAWRVAVGSIMLAEKTNEQKQTQGKVKGKMPCSCVEMHKYYSSANLVQIL